MTSRFLALCTAVLLSATPVLAGTTPATPAQFTDAQKQEIRDVVRDYLITNPQVLQESIEALQKHMQEEQMRKAQEGLLSHLTEVQDPSGLPVAGNPQGDVTVVEFFDYNCGYCKAVNAEVDGLLASDRGIRLVHREFPILSQTSKTAAEAALAANMQGKYLEMHDKLISFSESLSEEDVYRMAGEIGLDVAKLRTDMQSEKVQAEIAKTRSLAEALNIRGTPAFVIGKNLYPGALDKDGLTAAVERARAEARPAPAPATAPANR